MRLDEFIDWLENARTIKTGYKIGPVSEFLILRPFCEIEIFEGIDLDKEFRKDGLKRLLKRYTYSQQDERDGRPNPTKIDLDKLKATGGYDSLKSLSYFIESCKFSIELYREFCLDHPPEPPYLIRVWHSITNALFSRINLT